MILFRALSRFSALFDGDGPSALNRDTTVLVNKHLVFKEKELQNFLLHDRHDKETGKVCLSCLRKCIKADS